MQPITTDKKFFCFTVVTLCSYYFPPIAFVLLPLAIIKKLRISAIYIGLTTGLVLASWSMYEKQSLFFGMELHNIHTLEAVLTKDTQYSSSGASLYKMNVYQVNNEDWQTNANFNLTAIVRGGKILPRYSHVKLMVQEKLKQDETHTKDVLAYLKHQDIALIPSPKKVGVFSFLTLWRNRFVVIRNHTRQWLLHRIDRLPDASASLFRALFLGVSDIENSKLKKIFRDAGMIHVLALSGFHVSVVVSIVSFILKPFLGKRKMALVSIPLLLSYLLMVGVQPSLLRAVLMYCLFAITRTMNRQSNGVKILLTTAIIALVFDRQSGSSLSFQLSYLALLGIMLLTEPITIRLSRYFPHLIALPFAVSFAAQIATAPLLIFYFQQLYPIGIITSIVINLPITIFIFLGIASLALPQPLLTAGEPILEFMRYLCYEIAQWGARFPPLQINTATNLVIFYLVHLAILVFLTMNLVRTRCAKNTLIPSS